MWLHEGWAEHQGEGSAGQGRGAGGGWMTSSGSTASFQRWWSWDIGPVRMNNSAAFCHLPCTQQTSDKQHKCEKSGYFAIVTGKKFSRGEFSLSSPAINPHGEDRLQFSAHLRRLAIFCRAISRQAGVKDRKTNNLVVTGRYGRETQFPRSWERRLLWKAICLLCP